MDKHPLSYDNGRIMGTHVHGVFDDNTFRTDYFSSVSANYEGFDYVTYREEQIQDFVNMVSEQVDTHYILQVLQDES